MSELSHTQFWFAALQIVWINILLSGDNAVVIAMACRGLRPRERRWGMVIGAGLASALLIVFTVAVTALIVYSLRNAILRSREFDADARARQLDPGTALDTVLAGMPARTGRRTWHLGWTHPSGQERAAALPL